MRKLKTKKTFDVTNPTTEYYEFIDRINEELKKTFSSINSMEKYSSKLETNDIITNLYHSVDTKYRTFSNDDFRLLVHPINRGVNIHILKVTSHLRGTGLGSKIMKMIVNISNEMNIPVYLIPVQISDVRIEVLRKFYHGFGFKRESNSRYWKYNPIRVIDINNSTKEYRMVS